MDPSVKSRRRFLLGAVAEVKDGELMVPTRPGWGCEVNEEAVRAHPPKQPR